MSAMPCGCDEEAAHVCMEHLSETNHAPCSATAPASTAPKPGSPEWRKQRPLYSGVLTYFPDALMEVAHCSWVGNQQHNPGQALHWDRNKSTDEMDALLRHLLEAGTIDTDGVRHLAKASWRCLAALQKEIERSKNAKT